MLQATLLHAQGVPVPDLFGPDGVIRLLPAAELDLFHREALRLWCHLHGRYGLVTRELVAWLLDLIGPRKAIEIGAGHGDLAHHLGIRATDNKCQERPEVAQYYRLLGQPVIRYPAWVQKIDALQAVREHRPEVVIGSWVTEWIDPALPAPSQGGSIYGVKEDLILEEAVTYVLIGNLAVHGAKTIMRRPHAEHALPFLRSRANRPDLDRVFVWPPDRP